MREFLVLTIVIITTRFLKSEISWRHVPFCSPRMETFLKKKKKKKKLRTGGCREKNVLSVTKEQEEITKKNCKTNWLLSSVRFLEIRYRRFQSVYRALKHDTFHFLHSRSLTERFAKVTASVRNHLVPFSFPSDAVIRVQRTVSPNLANLGSPYRQRFEAKLKHRV